MVACSCNQRIRRVRVRKQLRFQGLLFFLLKHPFFSDYDIDAEEFLARAVLVHGGFAPSPWWTHSEVRSKFSAHIEQVLMTSYKIS